MTYARLVDRRRRAASASACAFWGRKLVRAYMRGQKTLAEMQAERIVRAGGL